MLSRRRFLVLAGTATPVVAVRLGYTLLPGDNASASAPTIDWNNEPCDHCGMIISDSRYAAAWIDGDGRQAHFDDIGCMVSALREHDTKIGTRHFVRGYAANLWLDAQTAVYFQAEEVRSPMAYGYAAFAARIDGDARFSGTETEVLDWPGLLERLERRG